MKNLINFLLFQLGWFACALGAAWGFAFAGPLVVAAILAIHFWKIVPRHEELWWHAEMRLLLKVLAVGIVVDTGLAFIGAINFGENALAGPLIPPFMAALWLVFATTFNHSMSWLKGRYALGFVFGVFGGPLAYYAGARLGALQLAENTVFALVAIGAVWGVAFLGILYFFLENPQRTEQGTSSAH